MLPFAEGKSSAGSFKEFFFNYCCQQRYEKGYMIFI